MRKINNNLEALRKAQGVNRKQLVRMTGKSEALIIRIERGADMYLSTALDICNALGCTLNDLINDPPKTA